MLTLDIIMPITQSEFDYLIKLDKQFEEANELVLGSAMLGKEHQCNQN